MSWALLLWLLELCSLLLVLALLLCFLRADCDLTLMWAKWQGRRPEWELTDMVVWVTGASSGIGEELVYQLSKLGVSLVLSARRVHELERVKRRCLENGNLKEKDILILPLDLMDRSSHEVATRTVLQKFGKIDILVNNGGRSQRSLFMETSIDVFKELMDLNYLGTVSLTKCVLPHMMERKQGKIVTVNSFAGITSVPLSSGYCASKHALRGFFNALRSELASYPGISISTVCPGPVQSDVVKNALTEEVTKTVVNDGDQSHKMATSRFVQLMLISMANDLKEVWIGDQPYLLAVYICQYMPTFGWWLISKLAKKRIENFKKGVDADSSYFKVWKRKHD
ncbi:dehydrogenase/reductase SDR family member 7 [Perognathus longimembris pacificus]|uniref:dehydrogenase/reductase SDR family member 7 n=1 Tax=Perognathus longimembris pacificus TaxID=214514 RepID=UPI0020189540|nr:dehydrogenase/reductase SDR family member 7 [Perognathus longimembris pacificus]